MEKTPHTRVKTTWMANMLFLLYRSVCTHKQEVNSLGVGILVQDQVNKYCQSSSNSSKIEQFSQPPLIGLVHH